MYTDVFTLVSNMFPTFLQVTSLEGVSLGVMEDRNELEVSLGVMEDRNELEVSLGAMEEQQNKENETSIEVCEICGKTSDDCGNMTNFQKHKNACRKKVEKKREKDQEKAKKKKAKRKSTCPPTLPPVKVTKFFQPMNKFLSTTALTSSVVEVNVVEEQPREDDDVEIIEEEPEDFQIIESPEREETVVETVAKRVVENLILCVLREENKTDVILDLTDERWPSADPDIFEENIQVESTSSAIIQNKCRGYQVRSVSNLYQSIACHELGNIDVVIENSNLHHESCAKNCYKTENGDINEACDNLQYSTRLRKIIERGQKSVDDTSLIKCNNIFLSHNQLSEKARNMRAEKEEYRLKLMNSVFRHSKLCATLKLHERFTLLISDHNVPRLQQLVSVAMRHGRSISHIVNKVSAAIDGIYSPHPSQEDKDLSFIVLKFGGPSLLDILYKAGVLPSVSTAYRIAKSCPPIVSSVKKNAGDCFNANVDLSDIGKCMVSLKMDENYVFGVLAYNQKDNEAYGACYQHGKHHNLKLNSYEDCEKIQTAVDNDELHIPKECLVVGITCLNEVKPLQPVCIWPSCSKSDCEGTLEMISDINSVMVEKYGYPVANFCTDGDSTRRIVANKLMTNDAKDCTWYRHVSNLPLMDYLVGPNGETTNFDAKHLAKRCWTMCLREKMCINGVVITKKLLKEMFKENSFKVSDEIIHPKDKQNVKSATTFLLAFIERSQAEEDLPYGLMAVQKQLKMLAEVFTGVLSFYVYSDASISQQLTRYSKGAYLLCYLYRSYKTNLMPSQLFHDIQASFIDALFCAAKMKEYCPNEPLYLVQSGTDADERFFGNVRLAFKGNNYSALDMINSARAMAATDKLLTQTHPEWSKKGRTQRRLQLDYSNPGVWNKEALVLGDVNIRAVWRGGFHQALGLLPADEAELLEDIVFDDQLTLRCPLKSGRVVGVKHNKNPAPSVLDIEEEEEEDEEEEEEDEDWSTSDEHVVDEEVLVTSEENENNETLAEVISCTDSTSLPYFIIEGKKIYKTSCLKAISNKQQLSKDRLRRVQGMTRFPSEKEVGEDDSLLLLVGDPVLITHEKEGPVVVNIMTMKKANQPIKCVDITNDYSGLADVEMTVKRIECCLVDDEKLFWKGTISGSDMSIPGKNCLPIKPSIDLSPPPGMTKFFFNMGLLRDMGVHLTLSTPGSTTTPSSSSSSTSASSQIKKRCTKCSKEIPHAEMRLHVAKHILDGGLSGPKTCGFCGQQTCEIKLKNSSRGKGKTFFKISEWDCPYYFQYGAAKKFNKRNNPCTNIIQRCPISGCLTDVWKYNFQAHFQEKHDGEEYPENMVVCPAEKKFVLSQ